MVMALYSWQPLAMTEDGLFESASSSNVWILKVDHAAQYNQSVHNFAETILHSSVDIGQSFASSFEECLYKEGCMNSGPLDFLLCLDGPACRPPSEDTAFQALAAGSLNHPLATFSVAWEDHEFTRSENSEASEDKFAFHFASPPMANMKWGENQFHLEVANESLNLDFSSLEITYT
jgi:hypothetical protein